MNKIELINQEKYLPVAFEKICVDSHQCGGCGFLQADYEGDPTLHGGLNKFYECHGRPDECFRATEAVEDAVERVRDTKLEDINLDLSKWNSITEAGQVGVLEEMLLTELDQ